MSMAETLNVPIRERNALLPAAGFAPLYAERPLDGVAKTSARSIVDMVLRCQMPSPALAVDRH